MNDEVLNMEIRKFLKRVGITSQRAIEDAVRQALANGTIAGNAKLPVKMTLEVPALGIQQAIDGEIELG